MKNHDAFVKMREYGVTYIAKICTDDQITEIVFLDQDFHKIDVSSKADEDLATMLRVPNMIYSVDQLLRLNQESDIIREKEINNVLDYIAFLAESADLAEVRIINQKYHKNTRVQWKKVFLCGTILEMLLLLLWQSLEIHFYGNVNPSQIDNIIMFCFSPFLYFSVYSWQKERNWDK